MILADKIIKLRKKAGLNQEGLAERIGVSRQAVSKWEMAQSVPELDKIIAMSKLFGVSTDALLKDEISIEDGEILLDEDSGAAPSRRVSLEEASRYIALRFANAPRIAIGVMLAILSPIALILLSAISEYTNVLSEGAAVAIGLSVLVSMVAVAVGLFISSYFKTRDYEYLTEESFDGGYGVYGMAEEKKKEISGTYFAMVIIGVIICVLSVIPLFVSLAVENELLTVASLGITMALAALGVFLIVLVSCRMGAVEVILQEKEYSKEKKAHDPIKEAAETVLWLLATAAYLAVSFITGAWHITWVIWIVAAALDTGLSAIFSAVRKTK